MAARTNGTPLLEMNATLQADLLSCLSITQPDQLNHKDCREIFGWSSGKLLQRMRSWLSDPTPGESTDEAFRLLKGLRTRQFRWETPGRPVLVSEPTRLAMLLARVIATHLPELLERLEASKAKVDFSKHPLSDKARRELRNLAHYGKRGVTSYLISLAICRKLIGMGYAEQRKHEQTDNWTMYITPAGVVANEKLGGEKPLPKKIKKKRRKKKSK